MTEPGGRGGAGPRPASRRSPLLHIECHAGGHAPRSDHAAVAPWPFPGLLHTGGAQAVRRGEDRHGTGLKPISDTLGSGTMISRFRDDSMGCWFRIMPQLPEYKNKRSQFSASPCPLPAVSQEESTGMRNVRTTPVHAFSADKMGHILHQSPSVLARAIRHIRGVQAALFGPSLTHLTTGASRSTEEPNEAAPGLHQEEPGSALRL